LQCLCTVTCYVPLLGFIFGNISHVYLDLHLHTDMRNAYCNIIYGDEKLETWKKLQNNEVWFHFLKTVFANNQKIWNNIFKTWLLILVLDFHFNYVFIYLCICTYIYFIYIYIICLLLNFFLRWLCLFPFVSARCECSRFLPHCYCFGSLHCYQPFTVWWVVICFPNHTNHSAFAPTVSLCLQYFPLFIHLTSVQMGRT
jgi:hypothetical protein